MAFNRDITDAEIQANGMTACPDKMTGTAAQNKARFDKLVSDVVKAKFNGLIDDLEATSAAGNIGFSSEGMEAATVKAAIEELKEMISDLPLIVDEETTTQGELIAAIEAGREIYLNKVEEATQRKPERHERYRYVEYRDYTSGETARSFLFTVKTENENDDRYAYGEVNDLEASTIPTWSFHVG